MMAADLTMKVETNVMELRLRQNLPSILLLLEILTRTNPMLSKSR